uniref:KIB1-4 beta-propeller domain-containing protein n=1 Tax=Salix viminalis TaxID=40686 RepID=A0A6N2N3Z3_SALVM
MEVVKKTKPFMTSQKVIAMSKAFQSCKPDDVEWTRQDFKLHDEDDSDYVRSVGVHKGDICILTWYEHLYFVKFDKSYSITLVDLKVDDNTCPTMRKLHSRFPTYLVETCGELLLVDIWVYKLDFDKKVWTTIKELKDQSIFYLVPLSGTSFSLALQEESRIHGNKIYLTLAEREKPTCVCLPCPNVKADWVQNVWILPVLED